MHRARHDSECIKKTTWKCCISSSRLWTYNLPFQCQWEPGGTQITLCCCVKADCIPLKPNRLWNAALSNSESHNSAGRADSTTFFSSSTLAQTCQLLPSILGWDTRSVFTAHHHYNRITTRSSGFFAVYMYAWLCMCVCVHCISFSVIRYNVFIKSCSVPALSSQCLFVPARPVSWLTHIIAP